AAVLHAAGIEVSLDSTRAAASAAEQVQEAISRGCDTVFACGGDGTIHDVVQGLVGSNVAFGIIPLGTANSLAHDLGLPLSPMAAAHAAITAQPRCIAVGQVQCKGFLEESCARYFTVAVGIGVDAHLFYKLNLLMKGHLGMLAY